MGNKVTRLHPKVIDDLLKHDDVDLTSNEIQDWYNEYNKSCGEKDSLTKKEFVDVYNSLFAGDASEFAEHVFRTFDANDDGRVDFREFIIGLCVSGSEETDAKIDWAFSMYDINKDGVISRSEMQHIIKAIYKMTRAEIPQDSTPAQMTNKIFEIGDLNKDDQISLEEFKHVTTKLPIILHLLECHPDTTSDTE